MATYPKHSMSNLRSPERLQSVQPDWFQKYLQLPSKISHAEFKMPSEKGYVKFAGFSWKLKKRLWIFSCTGVSCNASFKCVREKYEGLMTNSTYEGEIELITGHTCITFQKQEVLIWYMEELRKYLSANQYQHDILTSHTGILFESGKSFSDFKLMVFDHPFINRVIEKSKKPKINSLKFLCDHCNIRITRLEREDAVCEVASVEGEGSTPVSANRFSYIPKSEIPPIHKKCVMPVYMFGQKHLLGGGLAFILPEVNLFVDVFDWQENIANDLDDAEDIPMPIQQQQQQQPQHEPPQPQIEEMDLDEGIPMPIQQQQKQLQSQQHIKEMVLDDHIIMPLQEQQQRQQPEQEPPQQHIEEMVLDEDDGIFMKMLNSGIIEKSMSKYNDDGIFMKMLNSGIVERATAL